MEKLTQQDVVDALVQKSGLTKKVSERLSKTFFDVIIDGLQADEAVKINGLGTFKVITVADRESVNVNNGERIVIPGYRKVTFTPAATVELNETETDVEAEEEEPVTDEQEQEAEESVVEETVEEETVAEEPEQEEEKQVEEHVQNEEVVLDEPVVGAVEIPVNEFGGIDMLISTPESVEEIRLQYEVAKRKAAETLRQANEANAEMKRLERLLSNLQANTTPEEPVPAAEQEEEEPVVEQEVTQAAETPIEQEADNAESAEQPAEHGKALQHYLQDIPMHTEDDIEEKNAEKTGTNWLLYILIVVLLGAAAAFGAIMLYKYNNGDFDKKDDVKTEVKAEQKKTATPVAPKKSDAAAKPSKPKPSTSQEAEVLPTPAMAEQKAPSKPVGSAAAQEVEEKQKPAQTSTAPKKEQKPATAPAPAKKQQRTYVMKQGDTLTKLAKQTYGSKDSVKVIIRANKFDNPDNVPIGAVVILP